MSLCFTVGIGKLEADPPFLLWDIEFEAVMLGFTVLNLWFYPIPGSSMPAHTKSHGVKLPLTPAPQRI